MRHGEALPNASSDRERQLSEKGDKQAQRAGIWLNQQVDSIDCAFVSPYVRTKQTFTALTQQIQVSSRYIEDQIIPTGNAQRFSDYLDVWIAQHPDCQSLLILSHMPFVSYLLDALCRTQHSVLFATGSIAEIRWKAEKLRFEFIAMRHGT
jgi:phosphohistidine phosphatase